MIKKLSRHWFLIEMDSSKRGLLQFNPNNVEVVRKDINLDGPGRMDEAVELLERWVKMQNHFLKKDFSRQYLETTLVSAKGLVERAKQRMDKMCTLKTLMPEFYPNTINTEMFAVLDTVVHQAYLPRMTKEHYRVYFMSLVSDKFDSSILLTYYKYFIMSSEYLKTHDYNAGFSFILDFRHLNILSFITKMGPLELRQVVTLITVRKHTAFYVNDLECHKEGYGMRLKRIGILTSSKMVETLVRFFKQILSTKLGERIHIYKDLDSIYEAMDRDILPGDYGGKEKTLKELNEEWLNMLCAKENVELLQELNKAKTDESCRQSDQFNECYIGMPGSFRALTVD